MRLFVAVEAPPAWRETAGALQSSLPADLRRVLRMVDPALMHLTLRFLGEVNETQAAVVDAALSESIGAPSVPLALGRAGTFGPPQRTDVVWLGVEGDVEGLRVLAARAESAAVEAGLPPERRALTPHLTLARVQRHATGPERRRIAEAVAGLAPPEPAPFVATEVVLMRSHLGSGPPRYEVVTRYG